VLATAAAVAVVATVAAVIATSNGTSNAPAGDHPAYAGYTWKLTGLTDRQGSLAKLGSVPAQIAFSNTAVVGTVDNASIFGHYRTTSDGYAVTDIALAGSDGPITDHGELRIGTAVATVFVRNPNRPSPNLSQRAVVTAQMSGDRLVLQANGVTLRLSKVGPSGLSPVIDAVGYTWRAVSLTDGQGQLVIASRLKTMIAFERFGEVDATTSGATTLARFGLTGTGYVVSDTTKHDSQFSYSSQPRVTRAIDAMVASNAVVSVAINDNTMTLRRGQTTLTLDRGEAQPQTRMSITKATGSQFSPPAPNTPITEPGDSVAATP